MTNNNHTHDHDLLEQVERLLQAGTAAEDEMLNKLAGTVPQTRPEFQQTLETQLLAALASQSQSTKDQHSAMQTNLAHDVTESPRFNLAMPFTLVAALIAVMIAALLLMNLPSPETDPPGVFGSVVQDATATPILPNEFPTIIPLLVELTARAAETKTNVLCDVMRMDTDTDISEFPQADSQVVDRLHKDYLVKVRGFTLGSEGVPDWVRVQSLQSDDSVTGWIPADALTQGGDCRQVLYAGSMPAGVYFIEPGVTQLTACPTKPLDVLAAPSDDTVVIQRVVPDSNLQIAGELMLNTGRSWLFINWQGAEGWIAGDALPVACINQLSPDGVIFLDKTAVQFTPVPTIVPPAAIALSMATATPIQAIDPDAVTATSGIEFATAQAMTPFPAAVEPLPDGDYLITLPITGPSESNIMPGDVVNVLAEFRYSANNVIWALVADSLTVFEMNAVTDSPLSSFAMMHVTLRTSELNTIEILRNLAQEGVPFALTHAD